MTDKEKISRIIELQSIITKRIINDRSYHACDGDEYHEYRQEIAKLREEVWDKINPPSYLPGGDPQRPNIEDLKRWKEKIKQEEQDKNKE